MADKKEKTTATEDRLSAIEDDLANVKAALKEHQIFATDPPKSVIQNIPEIDFKGFNLGSEGSEDFLYPRAVDDPNTELVRVTVLDRPEVEEADPSGWPYTPESVAAVKAWHVKYLPAAITRDVAAGEQTGSAQADTRQARVDAYFAVTGYLPPAPPREEGLTLDNE